MPLDVSTPAPSVPRGRENLACWQCTRLIGHLFDFQGQVERRCKRCKAYTVWTGDPVRDASVSERHTKAGRFWDLNSLSVRRCESCIKVVALVDIVAGRVEFVCYVCKRLAIIRPPSSVVSRSHYTPESIVALMEERWQALLKAQSRIRAEVAVGLRFDVFKRDGFRCRYCGQSADDGAILHADHVTPQSKGGPTTLENLVTACIACNLGKSNKDLGDIRPTI